MGEVTMGNRGGNQRFAVAPVACQIFLARTKVSRRIEFLLITMMNLVPYGMQIVTLGREVLPVKIRVNPGANVLRQSGRKIQTGLRIQVNVGRVVIQFEDSFEKLLRRHLLA